MLRLFAIIAAIVAAGILVLTILLRPDRDRPSVDPMQLNRASEQSETILTTAQMRDAAIEELKMQIDERFANAPEHVREIALGIASPDIPLSEYQTRLESLSLQEINKGYGHPFPDRAPDYVHTLMREAVLARNTGAAAILAANGADLSYNDNEMAFQVVNLQPQNQQWNLAFPDYTVNAKFLSLWLRQADDVNISHPLYDLGTLLTNTPVNNLTSIFLLLESGADPWTPFPITTEDGDFLYEIDPFFIQLVGTDRIANEVAFRAALMGYYNDASDSDRAHLISAYHSVIRSLPAPQSPRDYAERWAVQKTARMIYNEFGLVPSEFIRRFFRDRVPNEYGGFYLGPDDLRSPYTSSQRLNFEDPWGPEKWVGFPGVYH